MLQRLLALLVFGALLLQLATKLTVGRLQVVALGGDSSSLLLLQLQLLREFGLLVVCSFQRLAQLLQLLLLRYPMPIIFTGSTQPCIDIVDNALTTGFAALINERLQSAGNLRAHAQQ
ncbi:hypothetical protein D3C79_860380 [compost metagenome]